VADADRLRVAIERSEKSIVVGASFIGMEAAAMFAGRGLDVTVVAPESEPFENTLGPEVGKLFRDLHEGKGVEFCLGRTVHRFEGEDEVEAVVLDNDEQLQTDMVIIGVGVDPVTDYLSGVDLNRDESLNVDPHMRVCAGLYAAGDIACFPDPRTGQRMRIEHWRTALQLGRVAARNMAGEEATFEDVPFFWTMQFFKSVRYVGHAPEWDEVIVDGELAERDFIAYYVREDEVLAAAGWGRDREMDALAELMRAGRLPGVEEIRSGGVDLVARLG
jgi:NADPH-dependent 2,4-dienoyl-CoA reductase/sulfur reductase-like enzyme